MEWLTVVRTCRPEKPYVGLTRQSRCPARTRAYYMEAALERDLHWFNWQLRSTTFHIKNYRNQRKQWMYFLDKLWRRYDRHYNYITYTILSYLSYDKLPHPRIVRPIRLGTMDTLDYRTYDISKVFTILSSKLASFGYPLVLCEDISEMEVYLSYYSSSVILYNDLDYFRDLYRILEPKNIQSWRIIYSHMMFYGYSFSVYDYSEGYLHQNYPSHRADHYFKLWIQRTQWTGEPLALLKAWFARMKRPSLRKSKFR